MEYNLSAKSYFQSYLAAAGHTEPHPWMHRWCSYAIACAIIDKNIWFQFGAKKQYLNQYIVIVGEPASRKSTAIKLAKTIAQAVGTVNFAPQTTSRRAFEQFLAGSSGGKSSHTDVERILLEYQDSAGCFILHDELGVFLGPQAPEMCNLLTDFWDFNGEHVISYKSRVEIITDPVVNLLGGITHEGLLLTFPPDLIGQGFLSRVLFVSGEAPQHKIADPVTGCMKAAVTILKELATIKGELKRSQAASDALKDIYENEPKLADSRLRHYSSRRQTHLLKFCGLMTALRSSLEMNVEDVYLANTVLCAAEITMAKALGSFGRSKMASASQVVYTILCTSRKPMTVADIYRVVASEFSSFRDLTLVLQGMLASRQIIAAGKAGYVAVQNEKTNKFPHTNFALVPEAVWAK